MHKYLSKVLPSREQILRGRCLGRFTYRLHHHELWHFHHRSLAGGLALGLFIALTPVIGHIPLVLIGALWLRVNIPAAIAAVMLNNPFTLPAILFFSFKTGARVRELMGFPISPRIGIPLTDLVQNWHAWFGRGGQSIWSTYLTIWIGALLLGTLAALAGYYGILAAWWLAVLRRWRRYQLWKQQRP